MKNIIKTELIIDYLKSNNLSKSKFCKLCKISYRTLNKILLGDTNFEVIALFRIAKMLGIQIHTIFN